MDITQVNSYNELCTQYGELIEKSSSSQEDLDKVYYEILSLFRSISAQIISNRPTHWAPVWHQLEVEKNKNIINSVREKNNKLFEGHREKIKREEFMFRKKIAENKKKKWEAAQKGEVYKGKFIKKRTIKAPKPHALPEEISKTIPITKCFKKNWNRRARKRLNITKCPKRHVIAVVSRAEKKKQKRKESRKRAFERKKLLEASNI